MKEEVILKGLNNLHRALVDVRTNLMFDFGHNNFVDLFEDEKYLLLDKKLEIISKELAQIIENINKE